MNDVASITQADEISKTLNDVDRRSYIGGSDAKVIAGVSNYSTALQLYYEKRGEIDVPQPDNEAMYWGLVHEDNVARAYAERTGVALSIRGFARHAQHDFIGGHIDRIVNDNGTLGILEVKTTSSHLSTLWGASGDDASSAVPYDVQVQALHYLSLLNAAFADIAVLIGGNELRTYRLERDDRAIEALTKLEVDFWRRVESGEPPAADFAHVTTPALIAQLYPGTNGEIIDLPEALEPVVDQYATVDEMKSKLRDEMKLVDADLKRLRAQLESAMGESAVMLTRDGRAFKRRVISRKGYEVKPSSYVRFSLDSKL